MSEIKTTARVSLTLEVSLTQPWSQEEKIEHVYKRAKAEALEKVNCLIQEAKVPVRILGPAKIVTILVETEN